MVWIFPVRDNIFESHLKKKILNARYNQEKKRTIPFTQHKRITLFKIKKRK
jgi:hypothetical protein